MIEQFKLTMINHEWIKSAPSLSPDGNVNNGIHLEKLKGSRLHTIM